MRIGFSGGRNTINLSDV